MSPYHLEQAAEKIIRAITASEDKRVSSGKPMKPPSREYFEDHYQKVDSLLTDVAARFQVDLYKDDLPAGKPDPIR